jgi:hypothetical protein
VSSSVRCAQEGNLFTTFLPIVTVCCHLLLFEAARDLHQGMNLIYVGV